MLILNLPRKGTEATKIPHQEMNSREAALPGYNINSTLLYPWDVKRKLFIYWLVDEAFEMHEESPGVQK
jgi:hypothetical protein